MNHPIRFLLLMVMCMPVFGIASQPLQPSPKLEDAPLLFLENRGQLFTAGGEDVTGVPFSAASKGGLLLIRPDGLSYQFSRTEYPDRPESADMQAQDNADWMLNARSESHRIEMNLVGANPQARVVPAQAQTFEANFYNVPGHPEGITGVKSYAQLIVENVYPNIDWMIYSHEGGLKYDFIVHPGGNPADIRMAYSHADQLRLTADGGLEMDTRLGKVQEAAPFSYQGSSEVESAFRLQGNVVSFHIGAYDAAQALTIDPSLSWSTYYGASGLEEGYGISTDASGNVYLSGHTNSANLVTTGGYQTSFSGTEDAFLVKYDPTGNLLWATYYGGTGAERSFDCEADGQGNVYLMGHTTSASGIASGGHQNSFGGSMDAFLVKFDANGQRIWSTYYGGSSGEQAWSVETDAQNNVYLTGWTFSTNNIGYAGFRNTIFWGSADGYIVKFTPAGQRVWGSYLGGYGWDGGQDIAVDASGNVFVSGRAFSSNGLGYNGYQNSPGGNGDAFLYKLSPNGARIWATYYGSYGNENGLGVAVDAAGDVYLAGNTQSAINMAFNAYQPTMSGTQDCFLAKFSTNGARLWSTYLGGSGLESFNSVVVDPSGDIVAAGYTTSGSGFANGGYQNAFNGYQEGAVAKFDAAGGLLWSSYHGGNGNDVIWDVETTAQGNIALGGYTTSYTVLGTNGAQPNYAGGSDAFASLISEQPPCNLSVSIVSTAGTQFCDGTTTTLFPLITGNNVTDFLWSNGSITNTIDVSTSGTYGVTITDIQGCTASASLALTVNDAPVPTANVVNDVSCNGAADGSATVSVSGGTAPYTYSWDSNPVQTTATATGLAAGTYNVAVSDVNGCSGTASVTITEPGPITVDAGFDKSVIFRSGNGPDPYPCATLDGTVATGGVGPYTYSWTPTTNMSGSTTLTPSVCPTVNTTYTLTATDANGCTGSDVVNVTAYDLTTGTGLPFVGNNPNMIYMCTTSGQTITVNLNANCNSPNSVCYQLNAGSTIGPCSNKAAFESLPDANVEVVPNPFSTETEIRFTFPMDEVVEIRIYNGAGQLAAPVAVENVKGGLQSAYRLDGASMPSGIYFYELRSATRSERGKLIISK